MKYRGTAELCQIILLRSFNIYTFYRRAKSSSEILQVLSRGSTLVRREHKTHALVLDPGKVGLSPSGAAAKVMTKSQRNIAGFSRGICRVR